jgi:hypothetical protein
MATSGNGSDATMLPRPDGDRIDRGQRAAQRRVAYLRGASMQHLA